MAKLIELLVVFSIYAFLSLCGGLVFSHIGLELIKNLKAHNTNFEPFLVSFKDFEDVHKKRHAKKVAEKIAELCKKEGQSLEFKAKHCRHTIRKPTEVPSPSRPAPRPSPESTPEALTECRSIADTSLCREYFPRCIVKHWGLVRRDAIHNFVCYPLRSFCAYHYRSDNIDDKVWVCP